MPVAVWHETADVTRQPRSASVRLAREVAAEGLVRLVWEVPESGGREMTEIVVGLVRGERPGGMWGLAELQVICK